MFTHLPLQYVETIKSFDNDILFTFFAAEPWGNAGSKRFIQSIIGSFQCHEPFEGPTSDCPYTSGACSDPCVADMSFGNLSLSAISSIIEIGQVGYVNPTNSLYLLTESRSALSDLFLDSSMPASFAYPGSFNADQKLPPQSSSSQFIAANSSINAVVISAHESSLGR